MKGFTLIEMMVSVAIFSVVMVIALGSLLAISVSDRKAESLKAVINNLNFAVDDMSRAVRTGSGWGCDINHNLNPAPGKDCSATGANEIVFTPAAGVTTYYRLESATDDPANAAAICNQTAPDIGCIAKSTAGGVSGTWQPITSPEVVITDYSPTSYLFNMLGSCSTSGTGGCTADTLQPILTITLSGYVNISGGATSQSLCSSGSNQCSIFHVQTSVTQRIYDQ